MRRLNRACKQAERLLIQEKVRGPRVDVERIARKYALVVFKSMTSDISGMLVPLGDKIRGKSWAIVVNDDHAPVRQRFTIAHELGHLLLHNFVAPHADRGFKVRFRNSRSSEGSVFEEIEANHFAAELLMPRAAILKKLGSHGLEYAPTSNTNERGVIADLAEEFDVSQEALSIRLSNLIA